MARDVRVCAGEGSPFPEGSGTSEAVAIYEAVGGQIAKEWLIPVPRRLDAKP